MPRIPRCPSAATPVAISACTGTTGRSHAEGAFTAQPACGVGKVRSCADQAQQSAAKRSGGPAEPLSREFRTPQVARVRPPRPILLGASARVE